MNKIKQLLGDSVQRSLLFSLVIAVFAPAVQGSLINYDFRGAVTAVNSGNLVDVGDTVTGTFSFDDRLVDRNPSDTIDNYGTALPGTDINDALVSSFQVSMAIGDINGSITANDRTELAVGDYPSYLSLEYQIQNTNPNGQTFEWEAQANTPCTGCLGLDGTIDSLIFILDNINLSAFQRSIGTWYIYGDDGTDPAENSVNFDISELTRAEPISVPEPSIFALFGLGLLGLGFARREAV